MFTGVLSRTFMSYFIGSGSTVLDLNTINGFTMTLNGSTSYDSSSVSAATLTSVVTYNYTPSPVPEPSTLALAVIGGLGALLLFRRRK
jgi:hypothetical protein